MQDGLGVLPPGNRRLEQPELLPGRRIRDEPAWRRFEFTEPAVGRGRLLWQKADKHKPVQISQSFTRRAATSNDQQQSRKDPKHAISEIRQFNPFGTLDCDTPRPPMANAHAAAGHSHSHAGGEESLALPAIKTAGAPRAHIELSRNFCNDDERSAPVGSVRAKCNPSAESSKECELPSPSDSS